MNTTQKNKLKEYTRLYLDGAITQETYNRLRHNINDTEAQAKAYEEQQATLKSQRKELNDLYADFE